MKVSGESASAGVKAAEETLDKLILLLLLSASQPIVGLYSQPF